MENNTTQNHNIDDLAIFKMEAAKIYENCELTGIKINSDESYIRENFGNEIAEMFIEYPAVIEKDQVGLKNKPEIAENFLHNIVKMDAIQYEINQQMGGSIDTKKVLNFELFMTDKEGKEHVVKFEDFQLGIGDTTKGFSHLLMQAKSIDNNNRSVLKTTSKLDDICKIPSQLLSAKIASKSHDIVKSLSSTIPHEISPEMSAFLKQFVDKFLDSDKQRTRKQFIDEEERQKQKNKDNIDKNDVAKDDAKKESENKSKGVNNPNKQIITADIDNITAKRYEADKEPENVKAFKADPKKLKNYEGKYNEIMSAENSLSVNDKKEQLNKLEKDFGISASEYLGIKQEQDELRKAGMSEAKAAQSQKKSLNNEQVATKTKKIATAPAPDVSNYDNLYLKVTKEANGLKAKFYPDGAEPEYIKNFKANPQKIKEYEKEFQKIYDPLGNRIGQKDKINNLEQTYKISISEFLGVKHEQVQMRIEATKDIQKNNLAKTSRPKEQIRTNQPTDRGL